MICPLIATRVITGSRSKIQIFKIRNWFVSSCLSIEKERERIWKLVTRNCVCFDFYGKMIAGKLNYNFMFMENYKFFFLSCSYNVYVDWTIWKTWLHINFFTFNILIIRFLFQTKKNNTIESNLKSINVNKMDLEFEVIYQSFKLVFILEPVRCCSWYVLNIYLH